jgi:hypothetical protein
LKKSQQDEVGRVESTMVKALLANGLVLDFDQKLDYSKFREVTELSTFDTTTPQQVGTANI